MKDLHDFEPPKDGEITLCEVDGRVQSMNAEFANLNVFTNTVDSHPKIHITRDNLQVKSGDDAKELFVSVDVPFLKQLVQIYYEHGFIDVLHAASDHRRFLLSRIAKISLKVINAFENIRVVFNPTVRETRNNIINEIRSSRAWFYGPIRCMSWHQDCTKIAIVTCDDTVRIYSKSATLTPLLKCKQQKNVTCIEWRPMSNSEIAVACETCVIIWNVDPNSVVTRPSTSSAIILQRIQHRNVMSIAWSPRGDVLATAALCDMSILVWDIELDRTSTLKRPGSTGNMLLKWSPSGEKMFSATTSLIFRVWECQSWQAERWSVLSGRVQAACWSHCGSTLLFTTTEEPILYALSFVRSDLIFTTDSGVSPNLAVPLFDLSAVDVEGVVIGGVVQSMDWDRTGNHLAVIFKETNCVAVFSVVSRPSLHLNASCLVAGMAEEVPTALAFQRNFAHGSCLSIAWSSGRLQYFPIVYSDVASSSRMNHSIFTA